MVFHLELLGSFKNQPHAIKLLGLSFGIKFISITLDNDFQNELFNNDHIVSLLNEWTDQIKDAVIDANSLYGNAEPSYEEWMLHLNFLANSISLSLQYNLQNTLQINALPK